MDSYSTIVHVGANGGACNALLNTILIHVLCAFIRLSTAGLFVVSCVHAVDAVCCLLGELCEN